MQRWVGFDKAHKGVELLRLVGAHCRDKSLHAGIAQALPVKAHDLERAPGGGFKGGVVVDQARMAQALVFGAATGITAGFGVDDCGVQGGQFVGVLLELGRVVTLVARGGQLAIHDVAFKQDYRLAVVEKPLALGLHFVDCVDAGQRHVEALSGVNQVMVFQQQLAIATGQAAEGFTAGDSVSHQTGFQLIGAHGGFGQVAVGAVGVELGTVVVEVGLQDAHRLRAVAVAQCVHDCSTLRMKNFLAAARVPSTPSKPITPPKNGAVVIGTPISARPWLAVSARAPHSGASINTRRNVPPPYITRRAAMTNARAAA